MIVVADTGPIVHLHWIGASQRALPPETILVVQEGGTRSSGKLHVAPELIARAISSIRGR